MDCETGKIQYKSKIEAHKFMQRQAKHGNKLGFAYKCEFCPFFHVTSSMQRRKLREQYKRNRENRRRG